MSGLERPAETDLVCASALCRLRTFVWGELSSSDQRRYLACVASCFDTEPAAYAATFPLAYAPESRATFVSVEESRGPIAILSMTPLLFQSQSVTLSAACVGSVCVHPQHRGRGHAQALLNAAVATAQSRGFDFLCLFASDQRLYATNGFLPVGRDGLCALSALNDKPQTHVEWATEIEWQYQEASRLSAQECAAVWRSLEFWRQPSAALFSFRDFCSLIGAVPMSILTGSVQKRLEAVLFFEKGVDFQGTWHGAGAASPGAFAGALLKAAQVHPGAQVHLVGGQVALFQNLWPLEQVEMIPSMMARPLAARAAEWLEGPQTPVVISLLSN